MNFLKVFVIILVIFVLYTFLSAKGKEETFQDEESSKVKKTMYFVYADWCGYCKRFKDDWKRLVDIGKKSKNFSTVELDVDDDRNNAFIEKFEISSFPTLMVFKDNGAFTTYRGEREIPLILNFIDNF